VRARLPTFFLAALLALLALAPVARASFGFLPGAEGFDVEALDEEGRVANQAGAHPYSLAVKLGFKLKGEGPFTDGDVEDLHLDLPPGLLQNPTVPGLCSAGQFQTPRVSPFQESASGESCPQASQVGVVQVRSSLGPPRTFGVFNLVPTPGTAAQLGFAPYGRPIVLTTEIHGSEGTYNLSLNAAGITQHFDLYGLTLTLWGNPWLVGHDRERGNCLNEVDPAAYFGEDAELEPEGNHDPMVHFKPGTCSIGDPKAYFPNAYLTLPPSCDPMLFTLSVSSWQQPGTVSRTLEAPLRDCAFSPFEPAPLLQLNNERASSPSGVSFGLSVDQHRLLVNYTPTGRLLPDVRAPSPARKAAVALPEGVSINPSVGAGLGVCAPAQYGAETASSPPGAGCPEDSKIGEFTVTSPIFEAPITGAMFLAAPHDNPFGSLIAIYLVAKDPERGVLVKVAGELKADPSTGRLTASFDDLPQLPYSELRMNFREGQRSPLATPPACGTFFADAVFTAWRDPSLTKSGSVPVTVTSGVGGGPCPSGLAPFDPQAKGGTMNARAGAYSPFYLRLDRQDTEQEIVSYSATFPTGLLGNVVGIPYCSDAAIEASLHRTGVQERDNPSCPASTQIGRTTAGYGLGSVLTYAPGRLYLAGPYRGSSFSVVAIDSALVGPFDLGVIVVRSAIRIDPVTTQASIDATGTDPIPHIIDGIPIHLRDIRAYLDRPRFTLNPTSCEPSAVSSALNGAGQLFGAQADDTLATATSSFQAFDCGSLGFRPKVSLKLKGGTHRGKHPALRVVVKPRPGDANIAQAAVTLPPSLFLEQSHIKTICTRAQFASHNCPKESIYGHVVAYTPLLEEPMRGDAILRSSDHILPDLVFALKGHGIEVDVAGRIDAVNGGLRGTFPEVPDAPVSKFELRLGAGKHSLLAVAGRNLCASEQLADSRFVGHANRGWISKPEVEVTCAKKKKAKRHKQGAKRPNPTANASQTVQKGKVRVGLNASLAPTKLPRNGVAPVRFSVDAKISPTQGGGIPPQLQRIQIEINRHGQIEPKGIPTCREEDIQPATTQQALEACRGSLVGEGRFSAKVSITQQAPFPSQGKIYAFNGTWKGKPAILAHVYGTKPVPTSSTIPFLISKAAKGTYATTLDASLPQSTSKWGYVTGISMTLGKTFTSHGKRHSYLSAGCPAPAGFGHALFDLSRAKLSFAGGQTVSSVLSRSCRVG
jgi:hypothetical protein